MKTPFLWAGSKDRDYKIIKPYIGDFKVYHEPFVGGGSVYFRLLAERGAFSAFCSDVNTELIATYETIRDHPEELIAGLPETKDKETFARFLAMGSTGGKIERASRFLYLNRNRFFGMGGWMKADRYARGAVIERIRFFSPLMQMTQFSDRGCWSWEFGDGSFIFCDPPYPDTNNKSCYRIEDDDVMALNRDYMRHVANSGQSFFWVTKHSDDMEQHADMLGVSWRKRRWEYRKPGQGVQVAYELYAWRSENRFLPDDDKFFVIGEKPVDETIGSI